MPAEVTDRESPEAHEASGAARIGRRLGVLVFWLLAVYVVGGAALSIIPSLYDADAQSARRPRAESCAREVQNLERTLVETKSRCARVEAGRED